MTRPRLALLLLIGLLATTPWPVGSEAPGASGLPGWAVYSLAATCIFGLVLFVLIGRAWDVSAGGERDDA